MQGKLANLWLIVSPAIFVNVLYTPGSVPKRAQTTSCSVSISVMRLLQWTVIHQWCLTLREPIAPYGRQSGLLRNAVLLGMTLIRKFQRLWDIFSSSASNPQQGYILLLFWAASIHVRLMNCSSEILSLAIMKWTHCGTLSGRQGKQWPEERCFIHEWEYSAYYFTGTDNIHAEKTKRLYSQVNAR